MVAGMARSGIAATKLLARAGAHVIASDTKSEIEGLADKLKGIEYENALGRNPIRLLDGVDMLVLSPVISIHSPLALAAEAAGAEVIGEIELGYRFSEGKFVCISGTNGKTTTTTLTGEIFKASGTPTHVLGNIGLAICEEAADTKEGDVIVAEVAALQLESIKYFHANAVAMLNITEDHLDRFKTMEAYISSKCRVFENQTPDDFALLNYDDPITRAMAPLTKARVLYFSRREEPENGVFLCGGRVIFRLDGIETDLIAPDELQIPGTHNLENAMAAAGLALCMGIGAQTVRDTLRVFKGVEHRIEFVCEKNGVRYINDSKGTNPDSTIKAVQAMNRPTVLLLGGYDKHADFMPLFNVFDGRIKAIVALGATRAQIIDTAKRAGFSDVIECSGSFEEAVEIASAMAEPGDNVLLSPACASWDMFRDFEQRGEVFKEIANRL
jgi:UDP-N-acetylmuramoylalanine--D-glutamate ligase